MKKIIIVIFLLLFLILSMTVYSNQATKENSYQDKNRPTKTANEQPNTNNDAGKAFVTPKIQNIPKIHTQEASAPNSQDQQKWYDKIFGILAIPTLTDWLLVIFNGVLAFFTFCLWKSTGKTDKTSRLRDRAYVYFGNPDVIIYPPDKPTVGGINIIVENVGNMPARIISIRCGWIDSPASNNISDPFPLAKWSDMNAAKFIGPKQAVALQGDGIPIGIIVQAKKREVNIFISMEVKYLDGFDLNKVRVTQMSRGWCFDEHGGQSWGFIGDHNCTDDDCQK